MQNQYTAKTLYGLEEILAQELKSIGAEKIEKGEITQTKILKSSCSDLRTTYRQESFTCL